MATLAGGCRPAHTPPVALRTATSLFVILAALAWDAAVASACSTCTVGDPTLTSLGVGQPYRNRVRLSLTGRQRREAIGAGRDATELLEHRFELAAAWSPTDRWVLSVLVPLVQQRVVFPNLARERRVNLGDAELRVRAVVFRDRALAPRHLLSAIAGLELPTAPELRDGEGQARYELQSGSGSADPLVGVLYSRFAAPHSLHLLATLIVPTPGRFEVRGGPSLRLVSRYQWQPSTVGLEVGVDGRVDGVDHVAGRRDPESGGSVLWLSAGLVAQPRVDLIVRFVAAVPVLQSLRGGHTEGLALMASVTFDG